MAKLRIDEEEHEIAEEHEIEDLVEKWTSNQYGGTGRIEDIEEELKRTRLVLGRLIDRVAEKKLFADDELLRILRGY
jgi:hypothetical protein